MKKGFITFLAAALTMGVLASCGGSGSSATTAAAAAPAGKAESTETSAAAAEPQKLGLAYQYGLSYAPAVIAMQKGYIEESYKAATGRDLEITWNQMSSGADINTAIAAGEIQGGFMGLGPAMTGVMKGVGYKIFANISGQEHGMMTNDEGIKTLGDLVGSDKQIALVNIGSIQHIILAKALADNGFDPHALDSNIVAMKHPDGMSSLETGSVACHLTSSPYIFKEKEEDNLREIEEIANAWTVEDSFIVGVASEELHDSDPELYKALCDGIRMGQDLINEKPDEAAAITAELDGNTPEVEKDYLLRGRYVSKTSNMFKLAEFMGANGFLDPAPKEYSDLVFENVEGD